MCSFDFGLTVLLHQKCHCKNNITASANRRFYFNIALIIDCTILLHHEYPQDNDRTPDFCFFDI